jgi:oligogalacturonide lyase
MKKILLMAAAALTVSGLQAQMGKRFPSERSYYVDPETGMNVTVLTSTAHNDRAPYQTDPMWTADNKHIIFRSSSRWGEPREVTLPDGRKRIVGAPQQIFFIEESTGEIIQATDFDDLGGVYLARNTNKLFYFKTAGEERTMCVMNLDSLLAHSRTGNIRPRSFYETEIGKFPASMGRAGGFCIDPTDEWAYISVGRDETAADRRKAAQNAAANWVPRADQPVQVAHAYGGIRKMNLKTGEVSVVVDTDFRVGHIQCSLFTPGEIVYCHETGCDAPQRMWFCTADGTVNKPLYAETALDWVTHETFASKDYVYFNVLGWQDRLRKQANGVFRINLRTDDVEDLGNVELDADRSGNGQGQPLTGRGFWHCNGSQDDRWAVGDTFAGSIWLIETATGKRTQLVSNTRMRPDHAHPKFSPDSRRVLFQSGYLTNGERLQLMMVNIPK